MTDLQKEIGQLIQKYERQQKRAAAKETDYQARKGNLSNHGYWSLGYYGARSGLYADVIDDLRECIEKTE